MWDRTCYSVFACGDALTNNLHRTGATHLVAIKPFLVMYLDISERTEQSRYDISFNISRYIANDIWILMQSDISIFPLVTKRLAAHNPLFLRDDFSKAISHQIRNGFQRYPCLMIPKGSKRYLLIFECAIPFLSGKITIVYGKTHYFM